MKHYSSFLGFVLPAFAALPAMAQQNQGPGPGPMSGYGPMWRDGWAWHHGMIFGPVTMLLAFAIVAALLVMAFRFAGRGACRPWEAHGHRRMGDAVDILEQRFARGEIDQAEFETKRALLSH
jgi:putative membrane protein